MIHGTSDRGTYWLPSALPALGAGLEHLNGEGTMFLALAGDCVKVVKQIVKRHAMPLHSQQTHPSPCTPANLSLSRERSFVICEALI
jgi:hypothetical protein